MQKIKLRHPEPLAPARFRRHFALHVMTYEGGPLPEVKGFQFKPFCSRMYPTVQKLEAESFLPMRQQLDRRPHYMAASPGDFFFHYRHQKDVMLCYRDGQLLAAGYALRDERTISGVVTDGRFRRQGAARALMIHCINHLLADASGPITLTVVTVNEPAIRLYESLGFRITGLQTFYREVENSSE